jgi:hypothetical protein
VEQLIPVKVICVPNRTEMIQYTAQGS